MGRLNTYLPDDVAAHVKEANLNLSAVTQDAVRRRLTARATQAWLANLPRMPSAVQEAAVGALDVARDEPPTRDG